MMLDFFFKICAQILAFFLNLLKNQIFARLDRGMRNAGNNMYNFGRTQIFFYLKK